MDTRPNWRAVPLLKSPVVKESVEMKGIARLVLLLVHGLWGITAHAAVQDYLITKWEAEDGLPENSLRAMVQSPDGYLWLGTSSSGLARFDGVTFTVFDSLNTPTLPSDGVINL